jgi:hypothetical protein
MPVGECLSIETIAGTLRAAREAWAGRSSSAMYVTDGELAGITFSIDFDDPSLADAIFLTFGGTPPRRDSVNRAASITASIRCLDAPLDWGLVVPGGTAALPIDGREFTFAVSLDDGPFETSRDAEWTLISFRGDAEPLMAFDGEVLLFRADRDWRKAVSIYLFCRLQRAREDVIFLHAGSIGINGRGMLIIGPKGAGKSTTTMALAARGHHFLGDECGAYVPSTRTLLPFRRPVGIKPGPRSAIIAAAIPHARRVVSGEGFVRIALDELIAVNHSPNRSNDELPLDSVIFLRGFRDEPQLISIEPTRDDIGALQPIAGSLINTAGTRRVFQLVDMLAHARVFALHPADPDRTAIYLEEVLSS